MDGINGLRGQMELGDLMGTTAAAGTSSDPPAAGHLPQRGKAFGEGYDAEGNLLDYDPEADLLGDVMGEPATAGTSSAPVGAPSPEGEGYVSPPPLGRVPAEQGGEVPPNAPAAPDPHTSAEIAEADADRLSTLATEINAITEQTRGVVISAALAVGKRLIEAKSLCPAGRFGEWLEKSVSYSERKAQDMMRLYVEYGRDGVVPESIAALDYSKAVALLAAPAEDREALAAKAAGEDLSVRQLQEEIRALKAERHTDQMRIEGLGLDLARAQRDIEAVETERDVNRENLEAVRGAIEKEREAAKLANAKAAAAEASANELRRLHSDAEDRAAASAQRASDAVNRANRTAKELAEARARIAELEEVRTSSVTADAATPSPTGEGSGERIVEVIPEAVTRELDDLRRQLAEARAAAAGTSSVSAEGAVTFPRGEGDEKPSPLGRVPAEQGGEVPAATAAERFKQFYANRMKPAFTEALSLLREVAKEDGHVADLFATALVNGCKQLINQLGEEK